MQVGLISRNARRTVTLNKRRHEREIRKGEGKKKRRTSETGVSRGKRERSLECNRIASVKKYCVIPPALRPFLEKRDESKLLALTFEIRVGLESLVQSTFFVKLSKKSQVKLLRFILDDGDRFVLVKASFGFSVLENLVKGWEDRFVDLFTENPDCLESIKENQFKALIGLRELKKVDTCSAEKLLMLAMRDPARIKKIASLLSNFNFYPGRLPLTEEKWIKVKGQLVSGFCEVSKKETRSLRREARLSWLASFIEDNKKVLLKAFQLLIALDGDKFLDFLGLSYYRKAWTFIVKELGLEYINIIGRSGECAFRSAMHKYGVGLGLNERKFCLGLLVAEYRSNLPKNEEGYSIDIGKLLEDPVRDKCDPVPLPDKDITDRTWQSTQETLEKAFSTICPKAAYLEGAWTEATYKQRHDNVLSFLDKSVKTQDAENSPIVKALMRKRMVRMVNYLDESIKADDNTLVEFLIDVMDERGECCSNAVDVGMLFCEQYIKLVEVEEQYRPNVLALMFLFKTIETLLIDDVENLQSYLKCVIELNSLLNLKAPIKKMRYFYPNLSVSECLRRLFKVFTADDLIGFVAHNEAYREVMNPKIMPLFQKKLGDLIDEGEYTDAKVEIIERETYAEFAKEALLQAAFLIQE